MLRDLAAAAGLTCVRILHTEAQDGKSIVDGHFQKTGWQIKKYVRETRGKVLTPRQVCDAMAYKGGIPGTSVSLLHLDREHLDGLYERVDKLSYVVGQIFTAASPLEVRYSQSPTAPDTLHGTSKSPAARVTPNQGRQSKRLVAYLAAHPLRLSLPFFQALHEYVHELHRGARVQHAWVLHARDADD